MDKKTGVESIRERQVEFYRAKDGKKASELYERISESATISIDILLQEIDRLNAQLASVREENERLDALNDGLNNLPGLYTESQAQLAAVQAERDAAVAEVEALKNMSTTNYICAVLHYTKYDSLYTFALPSQWYNLKFGSFDNYQEFSMQLVYLLGEARNKYDKERAEKEVSLAANTPSGAEGEKHE